VWILCPLGEKNKYLAVSFSILKRYAKIPNQHYRDIQTYALNVHEITRVIDKERPLEEIIANIISRIPWEYY
jgi:hypothetical protein